MRITAWHSWQPCAGVHKSKHKEKDMVKQRCQHMKFCRDSTYSLLCANKHNCKQSRSLEGRGHTLLTGCQRDPFTVRTDTICTSLSHPGCRLLMIRVFQDRSGTLSSFKMTPSPMAGNQEPSLPHLGCC